MEIRYPLHPRPNIASFSQSQEFAPRDAETAALPARMLSEAWSQDWKPLFPVVIFTGPKDGILTEEDRDLIWRRWGVPAYEHVLDENGKPIAEECDAHEGLHVLPGARWNGPVEQRRCFCGVTGQMTPVADPLCSRRL